MTLGTGNVLFSTDCEPVSAYADAMKSWSSALAILLTLLAASWLARFDSGPPVAIDGIFLGMSLEQACRVGGRPAQPAGLSEEYQAVVIGPTLCFLDGEQRVTGLVGATAATENWSFEPGEYIDGVARLMGRDHVGRFRQVYHFGSLGLFCQNKKHVTRYFTGNVPTRYLDYTW